MIRPALLALLLAAYADAAIRYLPSNVSPPTPDREFRGAWVATVNNIDWPSKPGLPTQQQQRELLAILDRAQQLKLNAIIFQVRPACDALYASRLEPWSEYLTGAQGRGPVPFWDPLEFAVMHAHARGLELHAWFNPFRARHSTAFARPVPNHVSQSQPSMVRSYGKQLWLDPALRAAQDHSMAVILDVVQRYDLDGVHIDDYFYPYPEKDGSRNDIPFSDTASWQSYQHSGGRLSRDDWRRDNVNHFIARMYREVKALKPWLKVGISPFGIYRPGYPAQIKGFDQYESLFADPRAWLTSGTLDYLAPQLYWRIDAPGQSFPVLLKWWTENNPRQRWIIPGVNTTALGSSGWPVDEIEKQIQLTRQQRGISGHIHWNMGALMKNKGGVNEALLRGEYERMALPPSLNGPSPTTYRPGLTLRVSKSGVEIRGEVSPVANARFVLLQDRGEDGKWRTRLWPPQSFAIQQSPAPSAVSVRLVDKFGNLGSAVVLARSAK